MLNVLVIGISNKTAEIALREQVFLRPLEIELLLNELKSHPSVVEAVVLSTCNRTEVYVHVTPDYFKDHLIDSILKIKKIALSSHLRACFYMYSNEECVGHLLRVVSGLESIVLGEKQILGQFKKAVELSRSKGMLKRQFNVLMNIAIRCGKKAQSETKISSGGESVSWAAVKMAEQMLETLENKKILLIGAGKMSVLTVDQLISKKISQIYVMNRTAEKAHFLSQRINAEVVSFIDIVDVLNKVDVCICSASAPHYLIGKDLIEKVMDLRNQRKLICIDISMPRNIDPEVKDVAHVEVLTIDDLDKVVKENMGKRRSSICQVENIILNKISELNRKLSCVEMLNVHNIQELQYQNSTGRKNESAI